MKGCFVAFEGTEGSGKSSQLRRAQRWLRSAHEVCATREPGGTSTAELVRELALDPARTEREPTTDAFLMNAARRDHCVNVIRPALERGAVVVSDRFAASTRAYQGAGDGVVDAWLVDLERLATDGLEPDRYLLFDVDVEVGLRRRFRDGDTNAIDRREVAFHQRVRDGYLALARRAPNQWTIVDAAAPEEAVWQQVKLALTDLLVERRLAVPS